MAWLRDQLIATKAPYVITVAHEVGYGLCKLAEEPRRRELLLSACCPLSPESDGQPKKDGLSRMGWTGRAPAPDATQSAPRACQ
jgi:hypothetical protein